MIDRAAAFECAAEWLPDFIAYAENPTHPLASDLLERARRNVWDSFAEDEGDVADAAANLLEGVAGWIVSQREAVPGG